MLCKHEVTGSSPVRSILLKIRRRRRSLAPGGQAFRVYTTGVVNDTRPADRRVYLGVLARMSPEARLLKSFELTDFSRQLFLQGLRTRFPGRDQAELKQFMLERLDLCHNRNY